MSEILLLAGDGIGQEIMKQAEKIIEVVKPSVNHLSIQSALIGGASYDKYAKPITEKTLQLAKQSDAILLGAVGGSQWEKLPRELRPEKALLSLRRELDLFANLRPAICFENLTHASSLKMEKIQNLDILIVRELVSGIYYGKPRAIKKDENGKKYGYNTLYYHEDEISRIAHIGFQSAMKRNKKLTSVDKANVLEVMELWRDVINEVAKEYPQVEVNHLYIDNAAMQLIAYPKQFDVIVTGNMFGDILSDCAAQLTGSIGMLPSASLDKQGKGMFEPVHGSAPDIAFQDKANPIAMILSLSMAFRYSLNQEDLADSIDRAVNNIINQNYATLDFYQAKKNNVKLVGTDTMGDLIQSEFKRLID